MKRKLTLEESLEVKYNMPIRDILNDILNRHDYDFKVCGAEIGVNTRNFIAICKANGIPLTKPDNEKPTFTRKMLVSWYIHEDRSPMYMAKDLSISKKEAEDLMDFVKCELENGVIYPNCKKAQSKKHTTRSPSCL